MITKLSQQNLDWPRVARWAVTLGVVLFGMTTPLDKTDAGAAIVLAVAVAAFWLLKLKAQHEQERKIDAAAMRDCAEARNQRGRS
jgi:hypothetical protein